MKSHGWITAEGGLDLGSVGCDGGGRRVGWARLVCEEEMIENAGEGNFSLTVVDWIALKQGLF